ncbi:MAG: hypothetical protein SGI84_13040 [Gemmatimonadota bacterium]|nr:hypothetical protein [Gemmatimonadota bacterium]
MRTLLAAMIITLVPAAGSAQDRIVDHTRARRYSGEEITVEGPVARVAPGGAGSLWISLGKPHPSATLVIVVAAEFVPSLGTPRSYEGAIIQVRGRVFTGEAGGTTTDATVTPNLPGGNPRTAFIVLQDLSRFRIITPPDSVPPAR